MYFFVIDFLLLIFCYWSFHPKNIHFSYFVTWGDHWRSTLSSVYSDAEKRWLKRLLMWKDLVWLVKEFNSSMVDLLYVSVTILFVSLICQFFHCSPKRPPSTRRGRNIPRRITSGPISIDVAFFASKVCGQVQGCCFMITSGNKPLLTLSCATMILFVILCQFKPKHLLPNTRFGKGRRKKTHLLLIFLKS